MARKRKSTFAIDVRKFCAKTIAQARLVVRRVALDIFGKVIVGTPVGNPSSWKRPKSAPSGYVGGRLRGNWQTSVARPAEGEIEREQQEEEGPVQAESALVALAWSGEGSIFLTNNLPYAEAIEYGHHSSQAPHGMVRVAMASYPGIIEHRAREARRKK